MSSRRRDAADQPSGLIPGRHYFCKPLSLRLLAGRYANAARYVFLISVGPQYRIITIETHTENHVLMRCQRPIARGWRYRERFLDFARNDGEVRSLPVQQNSVCFNKNRFACEDQAEAIEHS